MIRRLMTAALLAVLAAGCSQVSLVKPGRVAVEDVYSVEPRGEWSKLTTARNELWTVDGPQLQRLIFIADLKDGENLLKQTGDGGEETEGKAKLPVYRKGMSAVEISDLFLATHTQLGQTAVTIQDLRPATFGGRPGFRFEFGYTDKEGLDFRGIAIGTTSGDSLNMALFYATRLHFFPHYRERIEALFRSIRFDTKVS